MTGNLSKPSDIFAKRAINADARILSLRKALSEKLATLPRSDRHPDLAVYATGSLARREATDNSDLDAFFMLSHSEGKRPIGRIRDVKILNAVLEAADENKFPDFSNDGVYLKFLHIDDVLKHIGRREDDYVNAFTARMLMMLESSWLYNEKVFVNFRNKIIKFYFDDFHDHSKDFMPIFLINDILRFWRTLCLNYESGRQWRSEKDELKRAKGHLDNLKLKFSRLNICFSFICHLMHQGVGLNSDSAIYTSSMTPWQRLDDIAKNLPELIDQISSMKQLYSWFLDTTGHPKEDTLQWISTEENRIDAFSKAASFIEEMGNLTRVIAEKNGYLRYLIV